MLLMLGIPGRLSAQTKENKYSLSLAITNRKTRASISASLMQEEKYTSNNLTLLFFYNLIYISLSLSHFLEAKSKH